MYALLLFAALQTATPPNQQKLIPPPVEHKAGAPVAAPVQAPAAVPAKGSGKVALAQTPVQEPKPDALSEMEQLKLDKSTLQIRLFQEEAQKQLNDLSQARTELIKTVEAAHPGWRLTQNPRTGETLLVPNAPPPPTATPAPSQATNAATK